MSATPLINRKEVKKFLLEYAGNTRHHRFTRVSSKTLEVANMRLRMHLCHVVESIPSKGKTI